MMMKRLGSTSLSRHSSRGAINPLSLENISGKRYSGNKSARSTRKYRSKKEFDPLLSIKTIFGKQNSSMHSVKATLCIDALKDGCIDSFQEIFNLSHRAPVLIDPISEKYFEISSNRIISVANELQTAENCRREGKYKKVYQILFNLSKYLEKEKDFEKGLYFQIKAKKIMKESEDKNLIVLSYHNLGKMYSRLNRIENSMDCFEKQLNFMEKNNQDFTEEDNFKCRNDLIKEHLRLCSELKKKKAYDKCLYYLQKCLELGEGNDKIMGKINLELGKIYTKMREYEPALEYQKKYLEICEKVGDISGAAEAEKQIGKLVEKSRDLDLALSTYKSFLEKAEKSENNFAIGKSCHKIGMILIQKKEFSESVKFFERNYKLSQEEQKKKNSGENGNQWLTKARIGLGFAKGNSKMKELIGMIKEKKINELINWKDNRCKK